jgi:hypothetical protein
VIEKRKKRREERGEARRGWRREQRGTKNGNGEIPNKNKTNVKNK